MKYLTSAVFLWTFVLGSGAHAQSYGSLLDANSLEGWSVAGGTAEFVLSDGVLTGITSSGPNTFLMSDETYDDFVLTFEMRLEGQPTENGEDAIPNNSGVQIRSRIIDGQVRGYQVDVDAAEHAKLATLFEEGNKRLTLHDAAEFQALRDSYVPFDDGWNQIKVVANGGTIQTYFNGFAGKTYVEDRLPGTEQGIYPMMSGSIGFQLHSPGRITTQGLAVQWRNINIQPVPEPASLALLTLVAPLVVRRRPESAGARDTGK
ncbi:MAG: DUF1080 domain-containing protein [Planctomycetota bacterium]